LKQYKLHLGFLPEAIVDKTDGIV